MKQLSPQHKAAGMCAILVLVLGIALWIAQPRPLRGLTFQKDVTAGIVNLTISQFVAQENKLIGSISTEISPAQSGDTEALKDVQSLLFQIEIPEMSIVARGITVVGESVQPMKLVRTVGARAQDTFRWTIEPWWGPLAYPFDSYTAKMSPALYGQRGTEGQEIWVRIPVETVSTDFSGVNFTTSFTVGSEDGIWYTLHLERPLWLRFVAVIALVLMGVWTAAFPFTSKASEPVGLLALFGGVFTIRTSLLSGAPVFPSFIDYLSLLAYTYVLAMIALRRFYVRPGRTCPFCKSSIHEHALVCPSCTRSLDEGLAVNARG